MRASSRIGFLLAGCAIACGGGEDALPALDASVVDASQPDARSVDGAIVDGQVGDAAGPTSDAVVPPPIATGVLPLSPDSTELARGCEIDRGPSTSARRVGALDREGSVFIQQSYALAKCSRAGELLWRKPLMLDGRVTEVEAMVGAADGGVYFATQQYDADFKVESLVIGKWDADGELLWRTKFEPLLQSRAVALALAGSSLYVLADRSSPSAQATPLVLKFDLQGALQWQRPLGVAPAPASFANNGRTSRMTADADGNVHLISPAFDLWTFAADGSALGGGKLGGPVLDGDMLEAVTTSADGDHVLLTSRGLHIVLTRTGRRGELVWSRAFPVQSQAESDWRGQVVTGWMPLAVVGDEILTASSVSNTFTSDPANSLQYYTLNRMSFSYADGTARSARQYRAVPEPGTPYADVYLRQGLLTSDARFVLLAWIDTGDDTTNRSVAVTLEAASTP